MREYYKKNKDDLYAQISKFKEQEYKKPSERELSKSIISDTVSQSLRSYNLQACGYAMAVDRYLNPSDLPKKAEWSALVVQMNIIGSIEDIKTLELLAECNRVYEPRKIIQVLDTIRDNEKLSQLGYAPSEIPVVYVCIGQICLAPIL